MKSAFQLMSSIPNNSGSRPISSYLSPQKTSHFKLKQTVQNGQGYIPAATTIREEPQWTEKVRKLGYTKTKRFWENN